MKRKSLLVWTGVMALLSFSLQAPGRSSRSIEALPHQIAPQQLLVKPLTVQGVASETKNQLLRTYANEIRSISYLEKLGYEWIESYPGTDLKMLGKKLLNEKWVAGVYYVDRYRICEKKPNDYYFSYQYALLNEGKEILPAGSTGNKSGKVGADMKATEGWDYTIGDENEIVVAVIDTGIATNHEDLRNKVVKGFNFISQTENAEDDHGHGTFVSSLIGAETDNSIGIAGVSWKAKIMPLKALNNKGIGDSVTIALAIRYAAEHGAKVINMSFGLDIPPNNTLVEEACKYAFEKGCTLIAAVGNEGEEQINYPAAYDKYCLAVGATDFNDQWAEFSNFGPQIDVVAPGVYIWGAYLNPSKPNDLRSYKVSSLEPLSDEELGTSCSAAMASGAAALLLSLKPTLSPEMVMKLMKYTADDVNKEASPGWDNKMGYGRINLRKLLGPYQLIKKKSDDQLSEG